MPNELQERIKAVVGAKYLMLCRWCGGEEFDLDPKLRDRPDGLGAMARFVCSQCPENEREVRFFDLGIA